MVRSTMYDSRQCGKIAWELRCPVPHSRVGRRSMDRITITEHAHRTGDFTQAVVCAMCGDPLPEPFGWCAGCRMAFCPPCGRMHFCHASCRANRCIAGLCVRLVVDGVL